jgi:hypothetical protein
VQEVYFGTGKTFEKIAEKARRMMSRIPMNVGTAARSCKGLCAWYGAAQILFDVDLRCGAARWWR